MNLLFWANIVALLLSFFVAGLLLGIIFSQSLRERLAKRLERLRLTKSAKNPILRPGAYPWSAEAVLNPAALVLGGRTHLLYRAIGRDGVSRLGYAGSSDGYFFDIRPSDPAYIARNPRHLSSVHRRYSPVQYASGGSWGGCEDPRIVRIDGRVYVTFNMFDGWDHIRVAALSISEEDFLAQRFTNWDGPYILSKPQQTHKNWVLFPEKIRGKFAILHSVAPNIEIAYRDSIEAVGKTEPFIESWAGARSDLPARESGWDSFVRSAGPPPVKTDRGWLLFYHAIDERDPGRYKLGAMLLDLEDPTKVLYRAALPVLSPDEYYENHGKPGIVYACGAVVRDGTLFVYYGGADKVVCVASISLERFMDALMHGSQPKLDHQPASTT